MNLHQSNDRACHSTSLPRADLVGVSVVAPTKVLRGLQGCRYRLITHPNFLDIYLADAGELDKAINFGRELTESVGVLEFWGVAGIRCRRGRKDEAEMAAAVFRTIRDELAVRYPKVGALLDDAKVEVLAFAAFPREHWRKIWPSRPL